jgi:beta-RFAP synthase
MRGDLGRIHGSVGVAIDRPKLLIRASKSEKLEVKGFRASRIENIVESLLKEYSINESLQIEVESDIPEHMGFGSGTQLALAVGVVTSQLYELNLNPIDIALRSGRSKISGIGTHAFMQGGFLVDGGHKIDEIESVPPLVFRTNIPDNWYFVIGVPVIERGQSGEKERNAFKKLDPPPASRVAEVSRIVLLKMIPAILEHEIVPFGQAMTSLDAIFGDYWMRVQGGRYSHKRIEECITHLLKSGAYGAGQSSWGPALYGLADGKAHATELAENLDLFLNKGKEIGEAFVTHANNLGAEICIKE